jgi:predicted anti-sigma-YlaC factor YlaD
MKCNDCRKTIWSSTVQSLRKVKDVKLLAHIAQCTVCESVYKTAFEIEELIYNERNVTPTNRLTHNTMQAIIQLAQQPSPTKTRKLNLKPLLVAASLALCIGTGYVTGKTYSSHLLAQTSTEEMNYLNDHQIELLDWMTE